MKLSKLRLMSAVWVLAGVVVLAAAFQVLYRHPPVVRQITGAEAAPGSAQTRPVPSEPVKNREGIRIHMVAAGETLTGIAEKYALDVETVISANPGIGEIIHPGDELVILPQKGALHIVQDGDSLWQIAGLYQVEVEAIASANNKTDTFLNIGEKIFIPGARPRRSDEAASRAATRRMVWPANGEISSLYGYRWGRLHAGIDIANSQGTPIRAARAGRVISAGWKGNYGYRIEIEHGQGLLTLYGHLSDYIVSPGQYVQAGQLIGYMGNTGYSTGPHLHFEVRINGMPVDPYNFLP